LNDTPLYLTTAVFVLTYLGLAIGKVPWLHMDRAGIALAGAILMLITGMLSLDQAVSTASIDYKTIALLFGMMIVIAFLRLSGFFHDLANWALSRIKTPRGLLAATILLAGVLSAFLINDIVCLTLTPLVLHLARRLRFDPVPHLIALATAANIGSTATITGNPQNIFIGSHSGISYLHFAERLMPVAVVGLALDFVVIAIVYRRHLASCDADLTPSVNNAGDQRGGAPAELAESSDAINAGVRPLRWLRIKSVAVTLVAVVLFFTGLPLELVALGAAAIMLFGRTDPEEVYRRIDWGLLVMFTGLFIVVHAFQIHVVSHWGIDGWSALLRRPVDLLSLVSAGLSNLVSNVPAVLLMQPVIKAVAEPMRQTAWLALAMSSTLAGNLTVLGSVANLIVVESAAREGLRITFWDYFKAGLPITILTLAVGIG
jgi:Na+/H+ antiporter NhaD/arsenite permease-like protein